ncbi:Protein translocase subunit, partial [Quillaja saponaria]
SDISEENHQSRQTWHLVSLRSIVRPLSKTLISRTSNCSTAPLHTTFTSPKSEFRFVFGGSDGCCQPQWLKLFSNNFHSLTDTLYPKRRPSDKPRRKRASLRHPGPYAWVQYVPGEPILPNRPNEGSVKGRKEKKRVRQRRAFILAEKKKQESTTARG